MRLIRRTHVILAILTACSSGKSTYRATNVWKGPDANTAGARSVLVLIDDNDEALRRKFESMTVNSLRKESVQARGTQAFVRNAESPGAESSLRRQREDVVLLVRLGEPKQFDEEAWDTGRTVAWAMSAYTSIAVGSAMAASEAKASKLKVSVSVFDRKSGKALWTATYASFTSPERQEHPDEVDAFVKQMVADLRKAGVLAS